MSASRRALCLPVVIALVGLAGCLKPTIIPPPPEPLLEYPQNLSAPESLVVQLEVAYERQEIGPYATLLASDFKFIFLEADARGLETNFWTHDEDSSATDNLFEGKDVGDTGANITSIEIRLTTTPAEPAELSEHPGVAIRRIQVIDTFLDVNLDNGTTLRVSGDQQFFYFRRGREADGESADRWYLLQWQDLGNLGQLVSRFEPFTDGGTVVVPTTRGGLARRAGRGGKK